MKKLVPPPVYRLQLHRSYNIQLAELNEFYTLEERKQVGWFRKRWEWVPVEEFKYNGWDTYTVPVRGDLQWARRISKEFGIELPMW